MTLPVLGGPVESFETPVIISRILLIKCIWVVGPLRVELFSLFFPCEQLEMGGLELDTLFVPLNSCFLCIRYLQELFIFCLDLTHR